MASRSSSPSSSRCGGRTCTWRAASSIARGRPSSRAQSAASTGVAAPSQATVGVTSRARATNSRTASDRRMSLSVAFRGSPTSSGGTGTSTSPGTPSCSRLVVRIRSRGHPASNCSASLAQSSTTCSQLSSTSSTRPSTHAFSTVSTRSRPGSSRPSAVATAAVTTDPAGSGASSTHHSPPRYDRRTSGISSTASRVLPTPAGPVSVTNRCRWSSGRRSSSSRSRPTNSSTPEAGGRPGRALMVTTIRLTCRPGRSPRPRPARASAAPTWRGSPADTPRLSVRTGRAGPRCSRW